MILSCEKVDGVQTSTYVSAVGGNRMPDPALIAVIHSGDVCYRY